MFKPSILIVDDEVSFRSVIVDLLKEDGFYCVGAESGEEALSILEKERFEIVFSDLRMPGIDGITLLREIKNKDASIAVVMVTSHSSIDSTIEALRLGAYDYIIKPLENIELVSAIIKRISEKLSLEKEKELLLEDLRTKNHALEESRAQIIQHSREISALYSAEKDLLAGLNLEEVYQRSTTYLSKLLNGRPIVLWIFEPSKKKLSLKTHCNVSEWEPDSWSLSFENPVHQITAELKTAMTKKTNTVSAEFYAIQGHQTLFGILAIIDTGTKAISKREREILARFSASVAMAIENAQLYNEVKSLAIRDGLTGLFNRRHFEDILKSEVLRSNRHKHPVSLIFLDVDYFKHYNDTHGHPMGDAVLKNIARILQSRVRATDYVFRYGGEEFIIVLPYTTKQAAKNLAEDIRVSIASYPFVHGDQQPGGGLTISFGISESPEDGMDAETILQRADDALYRAKENGRNCVCG